MRRPPGSTGRSRPAPASAYALCLRWLAVRDRTEGELRQKLARKQVPPEQITAALEKLRGLGYLDDARFARGRAEALLARGRLGPRGVASRLAAAGIAREQVQAAVGEAMSGRDELALAREALRKRHPDPEALPRDPKLKARAMRFLLGRGFSGDVVARALQLEGADE